jgi:ribosomal protein L40E
MTELSPWTHTLCGECYARLNPESEPPRVLVMNPGRAHICCECGKQNSFEGVYVRADPRKFACLGRHAA